MVWRHPVVHPSGPQQEIGNPHLVEIHTKSTTHSLDSNRLLKLVPQPSFNVEPVPWVLEGVGPGSTSDGPFVSSKPPLYHIYDRYHYGLVYSGEKLEHVW